MNAATWILLVLVTAIGLWVMALFNGLVQRRNRIANAFAQIDVQLRRRYDLIPNLVEVARRYLAHEASTLEAVTQARGVAMGAAAAARAQPANAAVVGSLAAAETALGGSIGRLFALAESYPELKADATMRSLSEELASTENRVGFARQAYNDEVLAYNDATGQFPGLVVARLFDFAPAAMLQSTQNEQQREAPRLAF